MNAFNRLILLYRRLTKMDVEAGRDQVPRIAAEQGRCRLGTNSRLKIYLVIPVVVVIIFLIALLLVYFATDCGHHKNLNSLLLENSQQANTIKNYNIKCFKLHVISLKLLRICRKHWCMSTLGVTTLLGMFVHPWGKRALCMLFFLFFAFNPGNLGQTLVALIKSNFNSL